MEVITRNLSGNNTQIVGFSQTVFKILTDPVDNTFRGEGAVREEIEIIAYEHESIVFAPENIPVAVIDVTGNDSTGVTANGLSSTDGGCPGGITAYAWDVPGYTEGSDYNYVTGTSTDDTIKIKFVGNGTFPLKLTITTGSCGTASVVTLVESVSVDEDGDFNATDFNSTDFFTVGQSGRTFTPGLFIERRLPS